MSHVHQRGPARVRANLTPLIDVVFLLIVFFVLVAQITSAERVEIPLPVAADLQAEDPPSDRRVVLNILPPEADQEKAGSILLGADAFGRDEDGLRSLRSRLAAIRARDPGVAVIVRAAAGEAYAAVHDVVLACQEAGMQRVNVAVRTRAEGADG